MAVKNRDKLHELGNALEIVLHSTLPLSNLHVDANSILSEMISIIPDVEGEGYLASVLFLCGQPQHLPSAHPRKPYLDPASTDKSSLWTFYGNPAQQPHFVRRGGSYIHKAMPLLGIEVAQLKNGGAIGYRFDNHGVEGNTLVVPRHFYASVIPSTHFVPAHTA